MLRWEPNRGISVVNVMDLLSSNGYDGQLLSDFGIPASADWSGNAGLAFPDIQRRHMALLEGPEPWRNALRQAFYRAGAVLGNDAAAILVHGLPLAVAETAWRLTPCGRSGQPGFTRPDVDDAPTAGGHIAELSEGHVDLVPRRATVPHGPDLQAGRGVPVSVVQFFDWWRRRLPAERVFYTRAVSWERIGITREQVGSPAYYDANFRLIRDLGVDGVMWEWYLIGRPASRLRR